MLQLFVRSDSYTRTPHGAKVGPMSTNQRRDTRYDANLPVEVQGSDANLTGQLRNLSVSGAAVEFASSLGKPMVSFDIGDAVAMQPRGADPVRGVIVRHDSEGIAIKFDAPEEDLLAEIVNAVQQVLDRS